MLAYGCLTGGIFFFESAKAYASLLFLYKWKQSF